MKENLLAFLKEALNSFSKGKTFNSQQVIEKLCSQHEREYISWIYEENQNPDCASGIQNVNARIGKFIVDNQESLGIEKIQNGPKGGKVYIKNWHGEKSEVHSWRKL